MSLIDSIVGKLFSKSPTEAIVDVGGIRYRIRISIAAYESLPSKGDLDGIAHPFACKGRYP